jgi:hypothetical protein
MIVCFCFIIRVLILDGKVEGGGGSVVPCMVLVVFSFSCYILSPSILLLIAIFDFFIRLQVVDPRLSLSHNREEDKAAAESHTFVRCRCCINVSASA